MAQAVTYDEFGNPSTDKFENAAPGSFFNPANPAATGAELGAGLTPAETSPENRAIFDKITAANNPAASGGSPAPAPASGAPQTQGASPLPEFGMGNMNMPPAPTFDQPSDESLVNPQSNGLSADDQAVRSSADSIFGADPGAPGGKYSGGGSRRANPLRETDVGKRFAGASKAGTAYGNAFDKEGLMGGGKNAQLAGGDNAELGQQPSDLLLQMLQLLGQG